MKDELAERLLAGVMDWRPAEAKPHLPLLQLMAEYKYNAYQGYAPGMRFIENLALWLNQFGTKKERNIALAFVEKRLVFVSSVEMLHLVEMSYPDVIRPFLISKTAEQLGVPAHYVRKIGQSKEFKVLLRQTLFLGLSDGAHTDLFRRANGQIKHDQVYQAYEPSLGKVEDMRKALKKDLREILGRDPEAEETLFRVVCLLDDFSASGSSYLREKDGDRKGKIAKAFSSMFENGELGKIVATKGLTIISVIYQATEKALGRIRARTEAMFPDVIHHVNAVQILDDDVELSDIMDSDFLSLVDGEAYYDQAVYDEHSEVGGTKDVKRGFADCSLPLALSHNSPNNSVFLVWAYDEGLRIRGLFPRVSRHRGAG